MAKAFEFRLEKLLEVRRAKEEAAQRELASARQAVEVKNAVILDLMDREDDAKTDLRSLQQAGAVDVERLRLSSEFVAAVERQLRREYDLLQRLVQVEMEKRERLTEARKDVRVLERHREKEVVTYRQDLDRQERKFLDEIGGNLAKGA
ncbi:MAG TPA: flagellar export protein FliJ [Planctomycetota bacterium]|jgi:flagellar FliJ protein|nr:flagellar export protein FliJ [Planctomycetota bacterium]